MLFSSVVVCLGEALFVLWSDAVTAAGVCGCAAGSGRAYRGMVRLCVGELGRPASMYADEEGVVGSCLGEGREELKKDVEA